MWSVVLFWEVYLHQRSWCRWCKFWHFLQGIFRRLEFSQHHSLAPKQDSLTYWPFLLFISAGTSSRKSMCLYLRAWWISTVVFQQMSLLLSTSHKLSLNRVYCLPESLWGLIFNLYFICTVSDLSLGLYLYYL